MRGGSHGFIRRLRDRAAEDQARRQASRKQQAAEKQRAAEVAQEQQRAAQEAAAKEWQRHVLGPELAGKIIRGAVQAKRQGERMDHAQRVNQLSDALQELDQQIGMIDRLIIDLERKTLKREA